MDINNPWLIAVVGGLVVAIISAIILYFILQRTKKNLDYQILMNIAIIPFEEDISSKFKLLYNNKPTRNVRIATIKFMNTGNQFISKDDFDEPIKIIFSKKTKVLSANVSNQNPENLIPNISFRKNQITVSPVLLNAKDSFQIHTILSNYSPGLVIRSRIKGIKAIRKYSTKVKDNLMTLVFLMVGIAISFVASLVLKAIGINEEIINVGWSIIFILILGVIIYKFYKIEKTMQTFFGED